MSSRSTTITLTTINLAVRVIVVDRLLITLTARPINVNYGQTAPNYNNKIKLTYLNYNF